MTEITNSHSNTVINIKEGHLFAGRIANGELDAVKAELVLRGFLVNHLIDEEVLIADDVLLAGNINRMNLHFIQMKCSNLKCSYTNEITGAIGI